MAVENLEVFNQEMKNYAETLLPRQFIAFHKKVHLLLAAGVIKDTRADTGRMRGGWNSSIDAPDITDYGNLDDNDQGSETYKRTFAAMAKLRAFANSYLTNPVEYAIHWEFGTDKFPPDAMVQKNIQRVQGIVEK